MTALRPVATTVLLTGVLLLAVALPAHADVTGGCDGKAVINGVTYTPDNDTASNPVVVPDEDGVLIPWEGSAPFDNNGHAGGLRLHLGPAAVAVADWADDNGPLPNESSADGVYALDDFREQQPFPVRGLYRVSGEHVATGACQGFVMLEFDGPLLVSPIAQGAAGLGVVGLLLLALAGLVTKSAAAAGLERGRRVLGAAAGLLFGVSLAVLLQQASLWPLDNLTTIGLPLLAAILGFLLANWGPLGRGRLQAALDGKRAAPVEFAPGVDGDEDAADLRGHMFLETDFLRAHGPGLNGDFATFFEGRRGPFTPPVSPDLPVDEEAVSEAAGGSESQAHVEEQVESAGHGEAGGDAASAPQDVGSSATDASRTRIEETADLHDLVLDGKITVQEARRLVPHEGLEQYQRAIHEAKEKEADARTPLDDRLVEQYQREARKLGEILEDARSGDEASRTSGDSDDASDDDDDGDDGIVDDLSPIVKLT